MCNWHKMTPAVGVLVGSRRRQPVNAYPACSMCLTRAARSLERYAVRPVGWSYVVLDRAMRPQPAVVARGTLQECLAWVRGAE